MSVVVLTGAGISAESGIPVFRGETGLWEGEKVDDVATYEGYLRHKQKVHDFYNQMRRNVVSKKPNAAHLALVQLQQELVKRGEDFTLVTQNIDDLHEKAGSTDVIHMHGCLNSILCEACHTSYPITGDSSTQDQCKYCHEARLRPDIVWFGEMPYDMDLIYDKLQTCTTFLAIGTSGVVYPAAGFCQVAKSVGAHTIEFNLEASAVASAFDEGIYEKASLSVPRFVAQYLAQ